MIKTGVKVGQKKISNSDKKINNSDKKINNCIINPKVV